MSALAVTAEGELVGTLPCGHDAAHLRAGWHWRIICSACWSRYVQTGGAQP